MAKKKINALRFGFLITLLYILMTSIIISGIGIFFTVEDSKTDSEYIQQLYAKNVIGVLKDKIEGIINYIDMERTLEKEKLSERLSDRVNRVYDVFYDMYLKEKGRGLTESQIKKDLLDIADVFCRKKKDGYFVIFNKNGRILLNKDEKGLIKEVINDRKLKRGFIFTSYKGHKEMIYVKFFPLTNWYISCYIDLTDREQKIKNEIIEYLNNYRYGYKKHGYIFVVLFSKNSR